MAPVGGHSGIAQIPDDCRIHGSQKNFIRKRAVKWYLDHARTTDGKERQKSLPIKLLLEWLSEWIRLYGTAEDVAPLFEQYIPPLFNEDGTRRPDTRKDEIKRCLEEYKGDLTLPHPVHEPGATYLCERCGQFYNKATGKTAREHEDRKSEKCFCLSVMPFNPRPIGSNFNVAIEPLERSFEFNLDGELREGIFIEKLRAPAEYVIAHNRKGALDDENIEIYRGDYRDLLIAPVEWLD